MGSGDRRVSGLGNFETLAKLHTFSGVLPAVGDETAPVRHRTSVAVKTCKQQMKTTPGLLILCIRKIKEPFGSFYTHGHTKKILNISPSCMGENFLQMLMGMVDSYLMAHPGFDCHFRCFKCKEMHHHLSGYLLALGAAVASVMSKSLGEKRSRYYPYYHATESLKVTLRWCSLRRASLLFGRECFAVEGLKLQWRRGFTFPWDHSSLRIDDDLGLPWFEVASLIHVFMYVKLG